MHLPTTKAQGPPQTSHFPGHLQNTGVGTALTRFRTEDRSTSPSIRPGLDTKIPLRIAVNFACPFPCIKILCVKSYPLPTHLFLSPPACREHILVLGKVYFLPDWSCLGSITSRRQRSDLTQGTILSVTRIIYFLFFFSPSPSFSWDHNLPVFPGCFLQWRHLSKGLALRDPTKQKARLPRFRFYKGLHRHTIVKVIPLPPLLTLLTRTWSAVVPPLHPCKAKA